MARWMDRPRVRERAPEDRSLRDVSRLCDLFKGRIDQTVAIELIEHFGGLQEAATFLMTGAEEEVRKQLKESLSYMKCLREDSEKFILVIGNATEDHLFACEDCNKAWWKRVPIRKKVSRCFKCKQKFDPVPREHEWGIGEFECTCGNTFKGFAIMGRTMSLCKKCRKEVPVERILPPKKVLERRKPGQHNCNGINCYNCYIDYDRTETIEKPPVCIHPRSVDPTQCVKVHYTSQLHVSTGSTLCTVLDQGSLKTVSSDLALSLETILEED